MSYVSTYNETSYSHCVLVLNSVLTLKSLKYTLCFVQLTFLLVIRAFKEMFFVVPALFVPSSSPAMTACVSKFEAVC